MLLDAPLLLESGLDSWVDKIVFVDAPRQIREYRAVSRGWTEQEFDVRENLQWSVEVKRTRADFVIDNSGASEKTRAQVRKIIGLVPSFQDGGLRQERQT